MYLKKIRFYNFRNLADTDLEVAPGINFIVGKNGQGKTNIVEAIHFLSHARSFRTSDEKEVVRWGEKEASIFTEIVSVPAEGPPLEYSLGLSFRKGKKEAYLDGNRLTSLRDFLGRCLCVTFSPTDIALVKGPPLQRRRFLDKHLVDCSPRVAGPLFSYHRALANKAKLLKAGVQEEAQLEPWEVIMAEAGIEIMNARRAFLSRVGARAAIGLDAIAGGDGLLELSLEETIPDAASVAEVIEAFKHHRTREFKLRACTVGPHRDDVRITIAGRDARAFASQGQARSVVLALKLALLGLIEEARGDPPILVLDDFESELDVTRRGAVTVEMLRSGRQVFLTGTDFPKSLQSRGERILVVDGGHVEASTPQNFPDS